MPSASSRPVATLFSPSQERRRLLILLLGSALLFGAGIARRALWNPNEPVYGEGVREMIARGDYFLPYVNGTIYSDKPILYFWAMLAACKLSGGLSEAALRIPSVAGGVLTVLFVYVFGRRIFGIRAGFLAAACLATSVMFWWHSQYVQMDQMLSFLMAGSLVLFFLAKETAGPGAIQMVLSGVLMGLAFLTKGPVGVVVPAAAMGLYLLAVKEWRWIFRREVAWMAAACVVVAAPWYVSLAFTGHQAVLADFFIRHNLDRATDPFNHAQPFWYYLPRLFSDLFPWSLLLPAAFAAPARNELERRGRLFAAVWLGAVFVLFSAAGSKRGVYLLPLYPAAALLIGKLLDEVLSGEAPPMVRRWAKVVMALLGIFLCAAFLAEAGLALWPAPSSGHHAEIVALLPIGLFALAGGATLLWSLRRARLLTAVSALILCMSGIYLYSDLVALKLADRYKSPVAFCRKVAAAVGPEDEIRSHGLWRWDSSYLFYTGRLMPQIHTREEAEGYLAQGRKVYLVVESSDMDRFLAGFNAPAQVLARQQIGHKTTALLVNRREGS